MVGLLSAFSSAVGALGFAIGTRASASTPSHLASPASLHHLHVRSVREKLRDVSPPWQQDQQRRRRAEEAGSRERIHGRRAAEDGGDDCPGTPFLWKITEDATGKHVGFAVGTMHLPVDVVTKPSAWDSIKAAAQDSCAIYGELNFVDDDVTAKLEECGQENAAKVADIPDANLRADIETKILEISKLIDGNGDAAASDPENTAKFAQRFLTHPIPEVQEIMLYVNTQEYRERYLDTIVSNSGAASMDTLLLAMGRPAGNLEETSTHCDILGAIHPTVTELAQNWDKYSAGIRNSVDATLTEEIDAYECGDIDAFAARVAAGMTIDGDMNDDFLSQRNSQMASRMVDALKGSPDEKVLLAVGVFHWISGTKSLKTLLKEKGYTLDHVPEWDMEHAEDASDERCGAMLHPDGGKFVPAPAPLEGVTREPTHSVVKDTYYTLPPAEGNLTATEAVKEGGSSGALVGISKAVLAVGFVSLLSCS